MRRADATEIIRALAAEGRTSMEIAEAAGIHYAQVRLYAREAGIAVARKRAQGGVKCVERTKRAERMASMYRQGLTLAQIGQHFGLTRERVRQLIASQGLTAKDGGQHKQGTAKRAAKLTRQDADALARWGIDYATKKVCRADGTLAAFTQQRNSASLRGIAWALSFAHWLDIWATSGRLSERGRGKGRYVMSRIKDDGGYAVGNVHVQLSTENNSEGLAKCRGKVAANTGVWRVYPGSSKPWIAKVSKKLLGAFSTEADAAQARRQYLADHPDTKVRGSGRGYAVNRNQRGEPRATPTQKTGA